MTWSRHGWQTLAIAALGLLVAGIAPARATYLTGAVVYSSDSTGAPASGEYWNTVGGDNRYNLYLAGPGNPATVPFMNSGDGASTGINIGLAPGTYSYQLFGEGAQGQSAFGIALFANENTSAPAISAVISPGLAPVPTGTPVPSLDGSAATSTGSLSFLDGTNLVTLTGFQWADPSAGGLDRVGGFDAASSGAPDFVGSFSLTVAPVPEPASMALLGLGILGAAGAAWRRKARLARK